MIRLLRTLLVLMLVVSVSTTGLGAMGAMAMTRSAGVSIAHDQSGDMHELTAANVYKDSHDSGSSMDEEHSVAKTDVECSPSGKAHGEGACCGVSCQMAMVAETAALPLQMATGTARIVRIEPGLNSGMLTRMERPPRTAGA